MIIMRKDMDFFRRTNFHRNVLLQVPWDHWKKMLKSALGLPIPSLRPDLALGVNLGGLPARRDAGVNRGFPLRCYFGLLVFRVDGRGPLYSGIRTAL